MKVRKGKYQHYKGQYYEVLDIAFHSETEEQLVLYKPLYKDGNGQQHLWVRPYDMFFEEIVVSGEKRVRFVYADD